MTLEVVDEPVSGVLAAVARRSGAQITRDSGVYFVGTLRPEDVGTLTRKVRRLKADDIRSAVTTVLSEHGKVEVFDDGLAVVADRVEVLARVGELLDGIEAEGPGMWVIQLHVLSMSSRALHDFGLDVAPALDVAASFATASSGLGSIASAVGDAIDGLDDVKASANIEAGLSAVLRAVDESGDVKAVAQPMFVLEDGGTGSFTLGDSIPVPRRTTSDAGTVTTEGFDAIQTGLEVSATLREFDRSRARLELLVSNSDIVGFVEEAPRTSNERFESTIVVESGGVYLLGSVPQERASMGTNTGFLSLGEERSGEAGVIQIWGRVARIQPRKSIQQLRRPVYREVRRVPVKLSTGHGGEIDLRGLELIQIAHNADRWIVPQFRAGKGRGQKLRLRSDRRDRDENSKLIIRRKFTQ